MDGLSYLVGIQASDGVVQTTDMTLLNATSYGVTPKANKVSSQAIGSGRWERDGFISKIDVSGDVNIEANMGQLDILLQGAGFKGTQQSDNYEFVPGAFNKFLTFAMNLEDDNMAETAQDCLVSSLKLSAQMEAFVTATASVVGKNHNIINNKLSISPTISKGESLICLGAVIKEDGTDQTAKIESIDLTIDNKLEGKAALNSIYNKVIRQSDRGTVTLAINFNSFDKESYKKGHELLKKNGSYSVELEFAESTDETKKVKITLPKVKLSQAPEAKDMEKAGGMSKELTAYYDESISSPLKIVFENYTA
ncbi:phage tail tube protein [Fusobacterium gastrosuis]|uniref:phage tail tube protein n=1 Tax=Fusobacterium gastrosuis TaxID=1755100 RepID=UPI002A9669A4|nr:phage tail tube protein [Fusobacterium gastrosuis]MDY5795456.1 phage tail tube protein [Fusobacterium gastrosuis]